MGGGGAGSGVINGLLCAKYATFPFWADYWGETRSVTGSISGLA